MNTIINLIDYFENSLKLIQLKFEEFSVRHSLTFIADEKQVNLYFSNDILFSKLTPAFGHLESSLCIESKLDVYVLDEKCVPISFLSPPWIYDVSEGINDVWINDDSKLKILHQPAKNTLIMLNLLSNKAIYWVKSGHQIPYYESSAPLRPILHWWMSSMGSQLLHAAAVGLNNTGILLVGKGGSGKSNTAISCLNSNLYYTADDYSLLSFNPYPTAFSLYATGKLLFEDVHRYPFLNDVQSKEADDGLQDEKALFFLYPKLQEKLLKSFLIKAVFIPKVTRSEFPKITPISSSKAYLALAPSTIFQMHGEKERTHDNIVKLLKEVPSFLFELSEEPIKNTDAIFKFLTGK